MRAFRPRGEEPQLSAGYGGKKKKMKVGKR